jgi:hypothetical protein
MGSSRVQSHTEHKVKGVEINEKKKDIKNERVY